MITRLMTSERDVVEVGVEQGRVREGLDEPELVLVPNCWFDEVGRELGATLLEAAEERGVDDVVFADEAVSEVEVREIIPERAPF